MLLGPVHDVGVYDVGGRADGSVCPSRPTCGPEGAVVHLLYKNDRATRYWITSFCDRWGIDIGRKLRAGENMHPEVMCRKESWLC